MIDFTLVQPLCNGPRLVAESPDALAWLDEYPHRDGLRDGGNGAGSPCRSQSWGSLYGGRAGQLSDLVAHLTREGFIVETVHSSW